MAAMADSAGMMANENWRKHLADAVKADGRSMRKISLEAELNPGYVHSIIQDGKDASVENLMKIARVLGEPATTLLDGADMTEAKKRLLRIADNLSPDQLRLIETMAAALLAPASPPQPDKADESGTR
jgi:transcriptional regulator with XRE-family HTH domain